jgi:hypothetical protein
VSFHCFRPCLSQSSPRAASWAHGLGVVAC